MDQKTWSPPLSRDARPGRTRFDLTALVSLLIILASVGYGSWLTAHAILDGDVAGSLLRFAAASLIGTYYLVLFRTSRRRQFGIS